MLSTKEVAALAGCSPSNIRKRRLAGVMPAPVARLGQTWMFDEAAIRKWLETRPGRGRPGRRR